MTKAEAQQQDATSSIEQAFQQARACHQAGQFTDARLLYQAILKISPNHPAANHNMGVLAVQENRPEDGLPYFNAALDADPSCGQYWLSYIDALFKAGQLDDARQIFALAQQQGLDGDGVDALAARLMNTRSIEPENQKIEPAFINSQQVTPAPKQNSLDQAISKNTAPNNAYKKSVPHRGKSPSPKEIDATIKLMNQGLFADAAVLAQELTERFPAHGFGWKTLGVILKNAGDNADALKLMQIAVSLMPNDAESHNNLGITLQALGKLHEAEVSYRSAIKLNLADYQAHGNLGSCLQTMERHAEAETHFRKALKIKPNYARAQNNLSISLLKMGRLEDAAASYRQTIKIKPDDAEAHWALGFVLHKLGRVNEAIEGYELALKIDPKIAEAHSNLAAALRDLGRLGEAETSSRRALLLKPDFVEAHSNLGTTLHDLGRLDEAEASLRQALKLKPNFAEAHSNLLFSLTQNAKTDAEKLFLEHREFGMQLEAGALSNTPQYANNRDTERCLQVGFVSGDFRNHAVAYFIGPIIAHLSKLPQLSLHAYSNHVIEDDTTRRFHGYFAHWNRISGISDAALAEKIQNDKIDILIDLSGHTYYNRLPAFARKPAPIQASWIGYPGTTGMQAIDYYFSDRFLLPPGQFDSRFTEKIVHLPANAAFLPNPGAPPVNSLPALTCGRVTFGSFNSLSKLNQYVIATWAMIMRDVPDSRMVIGGMPEVGQYDQLFQWFMQEGISRDRLDFYPRSSMEHYLLLHQQVDICLDTFPYNGGTTTLHALWMGVPTITLAGNTVAGRTGAGILGHVGLEAFIAHDAAGFVQKGLFWAGNLNALSDIRTELRERFARSALGQPELIAAGLERALHIMWQRWCENLPAESFEVTKQEVAGAMKGAGK